MSVKGLYDSDIGDRLARQTLVAYHDDERTRKTPERKRSLCACGRELVRPYIQRNGVNVCTVCAKNIPRKRGGHKPVNHCAYCGKVFPRLKLVIRKGKLYCERCKIAF